MQIFLRDIDGNTSIAHFKTTDLVQRCIDFYYADRVFYQDIKIFKNGRLLDQRTSFNKAGVGHNDTVHLKIYPLLGGADYVFRDIEIVIPGRVREPRDLSQILNIDEHRVVRVPEVTHVCNLWVWLPQQYTSKSHLFIDTKGHTINASKDVREVWSAREALTVRSRSDIRFVLQWPMFPGFNDYVWMHPDELLYTALTCDRPDLDTSIFRLIGKSLTLGHEVTAASHWTATEASYYHSKEWKVFKCNRSQYEISKLSEIRLCNNFDDYGQLVRLHPQDTAGIFVAKLGHTFVTHKIYGQRLQDQTDELQTTLPVRLSPHTPISEMPEGSSYKVVVVRNIARAEVPSSVEIKVCIPKQFIRPSQDRNCVLKEQECRIINVQANSKMFLKDVWELLPFAYSEEYHLLTDKWGGALNPGCTIDELCQHTSTVFLQDIGYILLSVVSLHRADTFNKVYLHVDQSMYKIYHQLTIPDLDFEILPMFEPNHSIKAEADWTVGNAVKWYGKKWCIGARMNGPDDIDRELTVVIHIAEEHGVAVPYRVLRSASLAICFHHLHYPLTSHEIFFHSDVLGESMFNGHRFSSQTSVEDAIKCFNYTCHLIPPVDTLKLSIFRSFKKGV